MALKDKICLILVNAFIVMVLLIIAFGILVFFYVLEIKHDTTVLSSPPKMIYGVGFVRGIGQVTLKNKYSGFVSKVNFFSQQRVKKGDVILEYDDYDIRLKIMDIQNEISELKKEVELKQLSLAIKKIDPLPSDYRNLKWKRLSAEEKFRRFQHEMEVYDRLYKNKIVSELSMREKIQIFQDSKAEFKRYSDDEELLKQGLETLYIQTAEKELENTRLKLQNRTNKLNLLLEELKYYRIVAPMDGLCITNSDTVHGYNEAGCSAAVVHNDSKKIIYAYFEEREVGYIVIGKSCRFRSTEYDSKQEGFAVVTPYEVKKERTTWGDKCFFLVKFSIDKEVRPLRIDSTGQVEIDIQSMMQSNLTARRTEKRTR